MKATKSEFWQRKIRKKGFGIIPTWHRTSQVLTKHFLVALLLVNRLHVVALRPIHFVQVVALLLVHSVGAVPYRWPKHKKNDGSSQKQTRSRKRLLNWIWKQSIKDQKDSDLKRSGGFKLKRSQSESRSDWRELKKDPGFGQEL